MKPGDRVWFLKMPGIVVRLYKSHKWERNVKACELFVGHTNTYGHSPRIDVYTDWLSERTIGEPVDREWKQIAKAKEAVQ